VPAKIHITFSVLCAFDSDIHGSMASYWLWSRAVKRDDSPLSQTCFSAWPRFACGSWAQAPAPGSVSYPVHQLTAGSISAPKCPPARLSILRICDMVQPKNGARAPAPGSVFYPVHQLIAGSTLVPECPPARFSMIWIWSVVLLRNGMTLSDEYI